MSKVFIVNRGGHDFSPAEKYGEIVFLSTGSISRYSIANMYRQFVDELKDSSPDDYILLTGLSSMCSVACSIMAFLHGRVNFLLFRDGGYIERNLALGELLQDEN